MRIWASAIGLMLGQGLGAALAEERLPSAEQCRILTAHQPDADVAYRPSPDMVPADLAPQAPAPDQLALDLKGPVISLGSATSAHNNLSRQLVIGQVMVTLDARGQAQLSLNGQPLGADDQAQMMVLCARQKR